MPLPEKFAAFVEAVRASGLLPAAEVNALTEAAAQPDADPEPLARDLVRRGLLTASRARRLGRGGGQVFSPSQSVPLAGRGGGGMGEVSGPRHTRLDRDVALK